MEPKLTNRSPRKGAKARPRKATVRRQYQCLRCEYSTPMGRQLYHHLHDCHGVCPGCAGERLEAVGSLRLEAPGYSHVSTEYRVDGELLYAVVERMERDPLGLEGRDLC